MSVQAAKDNPSQDNLLQDKPAALKAVDTTVMAAAAAFDQARDPAAIAEDEESDSARAQKLQDAQAAAARAAEDQQGSSRVIPPTAEAVAGAASQSVAQEAFVMRRKCGHGVFDAGDEIQLGTKRGKPLTPEQLQDAIKAAVEKGWKDVHMYKADGTPDIERALQVQQMIIAMGLGDRISCCTNPTEYCTHVDEFKKAVAGTAKVAATAAVAGVAVAGAAALVRELAPA